MLNSLAAINCCQQESITAKKLKKLLAIDPSPSQFSLCFKCVSNNQQLFDSSDLQKDFVYNRCVRPKHEIA